MWVYLHISLVLLTLLRVLARNNLSPVTRLAWFMVLILMPGLGIIIYFLFGEVNLGKTANQKHHLLFDQIRAQFPVYFEDKFQVAGLTNNTASTSIIESKSTTSTTTIKAKNTFQIASQQNDTAKLPVPKDSPLEKEYLSAFRYASSINGFKLTTGNQAELMPDAATARSRLLADIEAATLEVNILYYIWLNDDTGTNVGEALIRAVKRGVKCRAMADGLGSRAMIHSQLWKKMKAAGVQLTIALPFNNIIKTVIKTRLDLRNHRKITIIDGKISYVGSQNCADPEFRVKPKYAPWVDILLRFEGPVVTQNQLLFASDWLLSNKEDSIDDFIIESNTKKDGFPALVWGDGPTERSASTPNLFANLLTLARESIVISTPYFVPNETVLKAIAAAAYRGVNVTIIFPAINDSWIVGAASRSYYRELLIASVNIYEFNGGLLHAKTLTIDGVISMVGSSNLDIRSFDLNYENNILLRDEKITEAIIQRQNSYIKAATPVCLNEVEDWTLPKRVWNNVVATVGPIL